MKRGELRQPWIALPHRGVLKDLSLATIGGEKFSTGDYPYSPGLTDFNTIDGSKPELKIISLYEYGFSNFSTEQARYQDYSLFLYIYNPTNSELRWTDERNMITMSVGNSSDYCKYSLEFCSAAGDSQGHDLLYLKYRVDISPEDLRALIGPDQDRVYTVSELEIVLDAGAANATAYKVGGCYKYAGYMGGYGVATTDLSSVVTDQLTLDLQCHDVVFRSDKHAADDGIKNQLNSVYFEIPDEILLEYGGLVGAKFGYYQYDSGSLLGVSTQRGYDILKPYEGVTLEGNYSYEDLPHLYAGVEGHTSSNILGGLQYYWVYNMLMNDAWNIHSSFRYEDTLSYVFQYDSTTGHDQIIDSGVRDQFNAWWALYRSGKEDPFFSKLKLPTYTVRDLDNRRDEDVYQIESFDGNWFQQFFGMQSGYTQDQVAPIVAVEADDLSDLEGKLMVDEHFKDELSEAFNSAFSRNRTLHLLRFASSDYFSLETKCTSGPGSPNSDFEGFVAQEKLYMDFDIISLTFCKDGKDTIIPVAATPINGVADVETPSATFWDNFGDGWLGTLKKVLFIVLIVLATIALIAFLPVIIPLLSAVFKLIVWVFKTIWRFFAFVFKKIGAFFSRLFRKKKHK